jgi:hypothetical protein
MDRAAQAYASEQFATAAQLLQDASDLHPGSLAIGCNLGLTRYQQGNRDEALALLNECVGAMRDKDTRRQMGELATALGTGDRLSVVSPAARQRSPGQRRHPPRGRRPECVRGGLADAGGLRADEQLHPATRRTQRLVQSGSARLTGAGRRDGLLTQHAGRARGERSRRGAGEVIR